MLSEYRSGFVSAADGSVQPGRTDRTGALVTRQAGAKYADATLRGYVFAGANQAAVAVTALNATATGLILSNPIGSGKNLVLIEVGAQHAVAATTAIDTIQLAFGPYSQIAVVHTTPIVTRNLLLGSGTVSAGLLDSSATLPVTPIALVGLQSPSVSATATTGIPPMVIWRADGLVVVTQGTSISLSATTAIQCIGHFIWEEVPA